MSQGLGKGMGVALVFLFASGAWAQEELADSDGDTVPDVVETYLELNPNAADSDGDGVDDGDELQFPCACNPLEVDANGDGICDGPIAFDNCRARSEDEGNCASLGRPRGDNPRLTGSGGCASTTSPRPLLALALAVLGAIVLRRHRSVSTERQR